MSRRKNEPWQVEAAKLAAARKAERDAQKVQLKNPIVPKPIIVPKTIVPEIPVVEEVPVSEELPTVGFQSDIDIEFHEPVKKIVKKK